MKHGASDELAEQGVQAGGIAALWYRLQNAALPDASPHSLGTELFSRLAALSAQGNTFQVFHLCARLARRENRLCHAHANFEIGSMEILRGRGIEQADLRGLEPGIRKECRMPSSDNKKKKVSAGPVEGHTAARNKGYYDDADIVMGYELVVVGGGVAGVCAAVAGARKGLKTALIQDRPVLGGNASSELRGCISGAATGGKQPNAREEGIMGEILAGDALLDPDREGTHTSTVMWEICRKEENLSLFLNTCVYKIEMAGKRRVKAVRAVQLGTEKRFEFRGEQFIDASGDGIVAAAAGAAFRMGYEASSEFREALAPARANDLTMGASMLFRVRDMGRPVPFQRPEWAYHYPSDESLPFRLTRKRGFEWIEYGGTMDSVHDTQEITEELLKCLYGVWDHLKNTPGHDMGNYQLSWVGLIPAKREGRRFIGDYILTENDIENMTEFEDAVAYGGWPIDIHNPEGFKGKDPLAFHGMLDWIYSIPLRCLYSKDLDNLWLAGRTISVSKIAFGSTRIMATLGICGEAVGYAAALALKGNKTCSRTARENFETIQQEMLKNGGYIPWKRNEDPGDLALTAKVSAAGQAVCEFISGNEVLLLDRSRGIMFPVTQDRLDALEILVENSGKEEVVLSAALKKANYPGDFYQKETLAGAKAVARPGKSWVKFEFLSKIKPGLYWAAIKAAKHVGWQAGSDNIPVGVYYGEENKGELKNLASIRRSAQSPEWISDSEFAKGTLDKNFAFICPSPGKRRTGWERNSIWNSADVIDIRKPPCPCFRLTPASRPYPPEAIINGMSRPEILPNMWISDPAQALPQDVILKWDKKKRFNSLSLIFDDDIDAFRPPLAPRSVTVKDYRLEALVNGTWQKIVSVKDNLQRRRVHRFETIEASSLKLTVNATWGAPEARIYEVRVENK